MANLTPQMEAARSSSPGRLHFADNLRWSMIVLVVFIHASVTYGPVGSWFFRDPEGATDLSDVTLSVFGVFVQAFFMGLLFLLAGYFVPGSYRRKGASKFVKDRAVRLGVPALIFIFLIAPPMIYLLYSDEIGGSFLDYYLGYLPDVSEWDSGPLWFTLALLLFTVAWVVIVRLWGEPERSTKLELRQWHLVLLVLAMGVGSFMVRTIYPIGTDFWNMQLCFFVQYIALFGFGIMAYRNDWLRGISKGFARPWKVLLLVLAVVVFPVLLASGGALEEDIGTDPYFGGWHWQSFVFAIWVEAYCIAIIVTLIVAYRERYNTQGKFSKYMTDNSFAVYVFHPPVVVAFGVLLSGVDAPILLKFLVLAASSLVVIFALAGLVIRRIPGLKSIL